MCVCGVYKLSNAIIIQLIYDIYEVDDEKQTQRTSTTQSYIGHSLCHPIYRILTISHTIYICAIVEDPSGLSLYQTENVLWWWCANISPKQNHQFCGIAITIMITIVIMVIVVAVVVVDVIIIIILVRMGKLNRNHWIKRCSIAHWNSFAVSNYIDRLEYDSYEYATHIIIITIIRSTAGCLSVTQVLPFSVVSLSVALPVCLPFQRFIW